MKKQILLLVMMQSVALSVFAEEVEINGLWYNLSGTTAEVIPYKNEVKYSGDIVIPSTVSYNNIDYGVTIIGSYAFRFCSDLTSITIPNSVTTIDYGAFEDCSNLISVTIPNSVTSIGLSFAGCSSLTAIIVDDNNASYASEGGVLFDKDKTILLQYPPAKIESAYVIPNSVTTISDYAFSHCGGLTSITIPNGVKRINSGTFCDCSRLTSITIPDGVTSIGWGAFADCSGLTSITIPNSVTSIGPVAFIRCSSLSSITIPNGVESIPAHTFMSCSSLTSISIPNSVTSIEQEAFYGCSGLTSIKIGTGVTSIGKSNFNSSGSALECIEVEEGNAVYDSRNNCNAIIETASNTLLYGCKNTFIPNSVTTISDNAFHGCADLTSITIPNSVTTIGKGAFSNSGLTSVTIPNSVTTIGSSTFAYCRSLTSISIPKSVTSIGASAFTYCSSLNSISIPNSVTSIGSNAFELCGSLTDVYCYAENVPATASHAFFYTPIYNATLHVPTASIYAYQAAEPWSGFKKIIGFGSLDVAYSNIIAGESNIQEISLNNGLTNLVAFQMDLTLPEGIGIDKTGSSLSDRITDEDQELTIGKLESGAYRITSTSLSLTPISGNDGTLLSLKLTAEESSVGGQATISNIIFSTAESEKVVMSDKTFDITVLKKYNLTYMVDGEEYYSEELAETTLITPKDEPTKEGYTFGGWSEIPETMPSHDVLITGRFYLYGDVNTDEAVDVVDVVDIARFVVATPSVNFREKLADLNNDNTVNIADAVTLVNHIAGDQNFARAMVPSRQSYDYDLCRLQLQRTQENTLSLCLDGDADFTAFQFEVELPENMDVTAMRINGQRKDGHQLLFAKVADNRYRVAALSLDNSVFKGSEGELLSISIDGQPTEGICAHNILFVTKNGTGITFDNLSLCETVTGVTNVHINEGNNVIFDLQGRKLSKVQRGVNIVNGKIVIVNK